MKKEDKEEDERLSEIDAAFSSRITNSLRQLKDNALSVIDKRERLPQPLFWSVFFEEIKSLRKKKKEQSQAREDILEPKIKEDS